MIVSASRRTDIPAFFSDWFYNRIKEKFVFVRNPMNVHQISRIDLSPNVVDCIVLWTKNPKSFLSRLGNLKDYNFYFQFTITGYGQQLEPKVPSLNRSIDQFKILSELVGPARVIWRYDPIIVTDNYNISFHVNNFKYIAQRLSGFTRKCVISFVDYYKKTIKNMSDINYLQISDDQIYELSKILHSICKIYKINIASCAEEIDLRKYGIKHGSCIDDKLIEEISGFPLKIGKDKSQRDECGCVASIDIGAYNTCLHSCLYCYANFNLNEVKQNFAMHNKNSGLLFGEIKEKDKISDRKVISCKILQRSLLESKR